MGCAGDDDGGSSKSPPDIHLEESPPPLPPMVPVESPLLDSSLADAPILLLVHFHKALREELADLCRVAVAALECGFQGGEDVIGVLRRRFDFLKLAYGYHSAAEDEVIFMALDMHVKNVACTYSLEHDSIDGLFDLIFHFLNDLEESRQDLKPFQELVICIYNLERSICQHMLKEEQQVFPLLMKQFSPEQQSSFVWQFICSIPIIFLEDLLPWMMSFLCPVKQMEVIHCIREIVPEESLLEVLISWIHKDDQSSSGSLSTTRKGSLDIKSVLQLNSKRPMEDNRRGRKACTAQTDVGKNLFDSLHLWHSAIQTDLREILEQLYQMKSSNSSLDVDSIVVRVKFLADVVIFYSNAVKKFFYPVLNELGDDHFHPSAAEQSSIEKCIESLHQLLQCDAQTSLTLSKFLQKLCKELESFVMDIGKQFRFQEAEVFPIISRNCSNKTQLQLLYMSLHVMPLGLLKCVITWFAARLSENESKSILNGINQGEFVPNKSFSSLLLQWFRIGYSGKNSIENFGKELQKIFTSRCSLLPDQIKESVGCPSLRSNIPPYQEFKPGKLEPVSADKGKTLVSCSPFTSQKHQRYGTSYSSEINLHVLFPEMRRTLHPVFELPGKENSGTSFTNEPVPVDLLFYFHKAIKKDLDYTVFCSSQLAENVGVLMEFRQCFYLLQFRNQFHSDAEDEIAFPALEAEGKVQNISQSYRIDHKLEVRSFSEISVILDDISKLQIRVSTFDSKMPDERMVKYKHLCRKLHHICKSMHKLISDHIQREEIELWPLFRKCFSIQEQEKIIGLILGRIKAETLQDMIPWLMGSLIPEEQSIMMSIWRKVTRKTMFDEWLGEWWEVYNRAQLEEESNISGSADPLEIISSYLFVEIPDKDGDMAKDTSTIVCRKDTIGASIEKTETCKWDGRNSGDQKTYQSSDCKKVLTGTDDKRCTKAADIEDEINKPLQPYQLTLKSKHHERLLTISQDDLEAAIRRVSRDTSLDPQKKSFIIQNLLMSRWIVQQQISQAEVNSSTDGEGVPGQHPSYRDSVKLIMGCKHYKRNCKLLFPCCNQLFTCIRCHDEVSDHSANRRTITKMMCMKCLVIQPLGQICSTVSCNNLSMSSYYCRICKLFEDRSRQIYHCPYCNLCRVGKGLGIDYFHCMNCNACMSRSLLVHVCREKHLEDNCPICREYIFTSNNPVKALPCGHLMHSTCFQEYTFTHYTCPICGKSLGDMQVYFKMLDALLAEEKIPDEYSGRTQVILCNDCEKKGNAPFHWSYHKCANCSSYNTRIL